MDENQEDWDKKRKKYLFVAVICFLIGSYCFINLVIGSYEITPSELETIDNLIVEKKPEFKETGGKNKRRWFEFKCIDNKTTFKIADFDYYCVDKEEIVNQIKNKDTISIKILKKDLKLIGSETSCEIHSLVDKDKEYLDINCRNRKDQKDGEMRYLLCSALAVMTASVFLFKKKPNIFHHIDPRIPIVIITIILFFVLL